MIIDKLHSNYLIKRCREKPDLIQKRLDKIASTILLEELEQRLSGVLDNESFLFIKDITVDSEVNLSKMDDREVAGLWAELIGSDIFNKINAISKTEISILEESGLAVFPDKATYYAYFIRDLTDGVAWDKWYYKGFKGLESVERQAVLKLIFKQTQEISVDILLALEEIGALEKFIQVLTEEGANEIYSKYLKKSTKSDIRAESREYKNAFSAIRRFIYSSGELKSAENYKQCLKIYALFKKEYPEFELDVYTRRIIEDIVFEKQERSRTTEEILDLVEEMEPRALQDRKEEETPSQVSLDVLHPEGSIVKETSEGEFLEEETFEHLKEFTTLYGGLFLLISAILKIGLKELIEDSKFPIKNNLSPLNYFLFFLGMKVTGKEIIFLEAVDPGIFLFAGINNQVTVDILQRYNEGISRELNEDIVERLLKKLASMKEHSSPYLDYVDLDFNLDIDDFNAVISMMAELLLKVFARDLRGFEESSPRYLLQNFIERESKVSVEEDVICVDLSKKPLDTVLKLSGLLDYRCKVPWLKNRKIEFSL